jgi:hypothetical protein
MSGTTVNAKRIGPGGLDDSGGSATNHSPSDFGLLITPPYLQVMAKLSYTANTFAVQALSFHSQQPTQRSALSPQPTQMDKPHNSQIQRADHATIGR